MGKLLCSSIIKRPCDIRRNVVQVSMGSHGVFVVNPECIPCILLLGKQAPFIKFKWWNAVVIVLEQNCIIFSTACIQYNNDISLDKDYIVLHLLPRPVLTVLLGCPNPFGVEFFTVC